MPAPRPRFDRLAARTALAVALATAAPAAFTLAPSLGAQPPAPRPCGAPPGGAASAGAEGRVACAARAFAAADYARARAALDSALAADPGDAEAAYYRGRVALATRDPEGAVRWLSQAAQRREGDARYHTWLGRALGEQARQASAFRQPGLASSARGHLERAVALAPDDLDARKALSEFYAVAPAVMGGGKAKAREQAAEIKRRNAYEGFLQMAWVLADGNDPAGAERELLEAARAFPDSAGPPRALGDLYVTRMSRAGDGFAVLERAARRWPEDMVTTYSLGRAGAIWGQRLDVAEQALAAYLSYAPRHGEPSHAAAHYRLGTIHARRGDVARARAAYEAALALDPGLAAARTALEGLR